jgi:diguanylate cyclase (GGDEF)-like protein
VADPSGLNGENPINDEVSGLILKNYSVLRETGLLGAVETLQEENRNLRRIIQAGKGIASQQGILMIVEAAAAAINDRFIPSTLAFLIEPERGGNEPDILYYENLKRGDPPFAVPSLEPYRFFFNLSPGNISFPVFEYMIGREEYTALFKPARPVMVMPLIGFGQVYGFVLIGEKVTGAEYSQAETEFLDDVMQFTSIGLQNNIHYLKAITDLKTRLYNNAYIRTRLDLELARVRRYGFELAVIIIDVDHFKNFNDNYGHLAGDKMLMRIAEVFMDSIRKGDVAGRFGGEEFVVLLVQCSRENACQAAERIRKRVERIVVEEKGRKLKATISLGLRHITKSDVQDAEEVMRQADRALYRAKASGRNKAFIFNTAGREPDADQANGDQAGADADKAGADRADGATEATAGA